VDPSLFHGNKDMGGNRLTRLTIGPREEAVESAGTQVSSLDSSIPRSEG
jgi:hypothetical protein